MSRARGGFDMVVGAVAVVVVGFVILRVLGFILGAVLFGVKLLIAFAVVAVGLKVLNGVLERKELRGDRSRSLSS